MERIRKYFRTRESYEPLEGGSERPDGERIEPSKRDGFSWLDYSIYLLLGIAMLWAWNMFLAAGPYFQKRFASNDRILANFQSTELSVSTITNLGSIIILTKLQANASYPKRVMAALTINIATFTFLAISTRAFLGVSASGYFAFLILMVFTASLATGLMQNGVFAYVGGYGREEYTQALMTGQAIAGVLPCIVQIASVLSVPPAEEGKGPKPSTTSAFAYFMTATVISSLTVAAFFLLVSRDRSQGRHKRAVAAGSDDDGPSLAEPTSVPLMVLFRKLFWLAAALFVDFAVTMFFPVFTQQILSVRPTDAQPRLFQPSSFIPLAFLFWNSGDLAGRLLAAIPKISLIRRPRLLLLFAVARIVWIPLYYLCNIRGEGAVVSSDLFYLFVVQFLFGVSNGFIGSQCMMGFVEWVDVEERAAAGGFMSLCLVAGLTAGSLLSFLVSSKV